jgi:hypothetical protein
MPARDPLTFPKFRVAHRTMPAQLKRMDKKPKTGVTQGGSSRKGAPAKVAATDGQWRPLKPTGVWK